MYRAAASLDTQFSEKNYKKTYVRHLASIEEWIAIDEEESKTVLARLHDDARYVYPCGANLRRVWVSSSNESLHWRRDRLAAGAALVSAAPTGLTSLARQRLQARVDARRAAQAEAGGSG